MNTHTTYRNVGAMLALLMLAGAATAATPPAAPSASATSAAPAASAEERAARRKAQMEKSASITFPTAPLIDPNSATAAQLSTIKSLSPAAVQAILNARPFKTPSELHAAIGKGLSDAERFAVYSVLFVKVSLNKSPVSEFELIPSTLAADRLAREFAEYRPYKSLDDFQREMQKYVSPAEATFLRRYVTL